MRSRLPHKRDANQPEIVRAFESMGCTVFDASAIGGGFPDLVVGVCGKSFLVEIKTPKGKFTTDQVRFFESWAGQYDSVSSVNDVINLVKHYRGADK